MTEKLTITELVLDPKVFVGTVTVGGRPVRFARISHPRHGDLDFELTDEVVDLLREIE